MCRPILVMPSWCRMLLLCPATGLCFLAVVGSLKSTGITNTVGALALPKASCTAKALFHQAH